MSQVELPPTHSLTSPLLHRDPRGENTNLLYITKLNNKVFLISNISNIYSKIIYTKIFPGNSELRVRNQAPGQSPSADPAAGDSASLIRLQQWHLLTGE